MVVLQNNSKGSLLYILKIYISVFPNDYRILFHE